MLCCLLAFGALFGAALVRWRRIVIVAAALPLLSGAAAPGQHPVSLPLLWCGDAMTRTST